MPSIYNVRAEVERGVGGNVDEVREVACNCSSEHLPDVDKGREGVKYFVDVIN